MTQEEKDEFRALMREAQSCPLECRAEPCRAPAPEQKSTPVWKWVASIGAGLATLGLAALLAMVLNTSSGLEVARTKVDSVEKRVAGIDVKLDAMTALLHELIGKDAAQADRHRQPVDP
jgi:hypothetical protein